MQTVPPAPIDAAFLRDAVIFGGLPQHALLRISEMAQLRHVDTGSVVFEEGESAHSMFVVCDGELEITKRRRDGSHLRLARLRRGDCVGEMSLIEIQPRSAGAHALRPTALAVLENAAIARLYHTDLECYTLLMLNIAREISRRLRLADQRLSETLL